MVINLNELFTSGIGAVLESPYFQNKYLTSLVILLAFLIVAKVVLWIFSRYLMAFARKTKTKVDDLLFAETKWPVFYLIVFYGVKISLVNLQINGLATSTINSLIALFFILLLSRILGVIIDAWGETLSKKTKTQIDDVLLPLFHKVAKVVFVIIALMWVLNIWNINITPYLAGVGISGLILGMALQDSLKNVFGGISLILDKNFNIGDPIKLESGELGTIQEIGLRSTKMLTYDNELVFIPNGQLATMRIHNFIKPNNRVRKIVEFSVGYESDPEKVKKVVLKAMKTVKDIYDEPYMDVIMTKMGDSGLHFRARFWVDWNNAYSKFVEVTQTVYTALTREKIDVPYPTRVVYLKQEK